MKTLPMTLGRCLAIPLAFAALLLSCAANAQSQGGGGGGSGDQSNTVCMSSFQSALIPLEGGAAGFGAVNQSTDALGAFQLTPAALQDAGFQNADGSWTAQAQAMGVNSQASFLSNPSAQLAADNAYNAKNVQYMGNGWDGQTVNGSTLDSGNLAYCSEALGAGGCKQYLQTGQVPAQDLPGNPQWQNGGFAKNMNFMGNTSTSGCSATDVNTTTQNGVTTTTVAGLYCDPAIMNQLVSNSQQMVNAWTLLAERPETGYTLLGGQSVLQAAGLIGPGQPGYVNPGSGLGSGGGPPPFGGADFAMTSCLSKLSGNGIDIIFSVPSIDQILNQLLQMACNMAGQLFTQLTAPLDQSVYQAFSLNGAIPGLDLGTFSANGGSGGAGGSLLTLGGNANSISLSPDNSWYQTNPTIGSNGANSYGSIFGNGVGGGP
jgi:hypothetical protein